MDRICYIVCLTILVLVASIVVSIIIIVRSQNTTDEYPIKYTAARNAINRVESYGPQLSHNLDGIPIYYINLERSKGRDFRMKSQLIRLGLTATRVDAIDGRNIRAVNKLTPAETGALLSHLKAIQTAYDNNDQVALICEDDVCFHLVPYWGKSLQDIISECPKPWNTINFAPTLRREDTDSYVKYNCRNSSWGCVFYIVNREGMFNILEAYKQNRISLTVADAYVYEKSGLSYEYHKRILVFSAFYHEGGKSTISPNGGATNIIIDTAYEGLKMHKLLPINTIPKYIYQVTNRESIHPGIRKNIENIKRMNPDWYHTTFDMEEIDEYLANNHSGIIYETYVKINPEYNAARVDFFRYVIMYDKGGVYLDDKSSISKPLNLIIHESDQYLLSHWDSKDWKSFLGNEHGEFQQWHIICRPHHPFLAAVINKVICNINQATPNLVGKNVIFITGPIPYTQAIIPLVDIYHHRIAYREKDLNLIYNNVPGYQSSKQLKSYNALKTPIIIQSIAL